MISNNFSDRFIDDMKPRIYSENRVIYTGVLENKSLNRRIPVAVTAVRLYAEEMDAQEQAQFNRERDNITQLNSLFPDCAHFAKCFGLRDDRFFFELGEYTLESILPNSGESPSKMLSIARGIIQAVNFMHKNGWGHGDLHPSHILFFQGTPKLIDFKHMCKIDAPAPPVVTKHFYFASPEAWCSKASDLTEVIDPAADDIYRLGLILILCLNPTHLPKFVWKGTTPLGSFDVEDAKEHHSYIKECYAKMSPAEFLNFNPKDRITAEIALTRFEQLVDLPTEPRMDFAEDSSRDPIEGGYKLCRFGTMVWNGKKVTAVKLITLPPNSLMDIPEVNDIAEKERANLKIVDQFNNPLFVKCYHIGKDLYFEACEFDFHDVAKGAINPSTKAPYTLGERQKMINDIGYGITFLHNKGYIHRDLKPENFFVCDSQGKLGDFGLMESLGTHPLSANINSLDLAPPETVLAYINEQETMADGYPALAEDRWMFGITALEFLRGKTLPLWFTDRKSIFYPHPIRSKIDNYFKELELLLEQDIGQNFKGLLNPKPEERKPINEVL